MALFDDSEWLRIFYAYRRKVAKRRRRRLKRRGCCTNGACHKKPKPGKTKCDACLEVQRRSN